MKFTVIMMLFPMVVFGKLIPVCQSCQIKDARDAIELAQQGDVIRFASGIHKVSELVIEIPELTIEGENGAILDGDGLTILYPHAESIKIKNLSFQNVKTNYVEDRAAIKANNADNIIIESLKLRNTFFGILLEKCEKGIIRNCDIVGNSDVTNYLEASNGNAIHLWYCKSMLIEGNKVMKHRDGIYFEFVERSTIRHNWSEANLRYGLHFMFSNDNEYIENTFEKNGAGVAVMYSKKVHMYSNRFLDNWGETSYGLLLKDINDSELRGNLFYRNTTAISADNTMRLKVHHNRFEANGYALRIFGNCMENVFEANDFADNSFDITTNSNVSYNEFRGNYWQEYSGYDLNKDGVGDVPFRPVKLFTYIIAESPAAIILMRSIFIDLLNLAEKVTPVITPENLVDAKPSMLPINDKIRSGF